MITRQHVVLVLISGVILSSAIVDFDPGLAVLVSIGAGLGAILPDIQMKRPREKPLLTIAWAIVQAGKRVCVPFMCTMYRHVFNIPVEPGDKRLTHSFPGIFLYFLFFSAIAYVPVFLFKNEMPALLLTGLLAGLLFGMLLHLAEDLCCRKGITPFYPFHDTVVFGSIRPCDVLDVRITGYHVYHATVLFFFLVIDYAINASASEKIAMGIFAIAVCQVSMIWQSEVRIRLPENSGADAGEEAAA